MPDGDDVVMKGSDEVRGEQSFSAFPQVRAAQATLTGDIPVDNLPIGLVKTSALASHTEEFGQRNTAKLAVTIYFLLAPEHPNSCCTAVVLFIKCSRFAMRGFTSLDPFAKC